MKFKKSHYETAFNLSKREKGVGHSLYVTRLWCGLYRDYGVGTRGGTGSTVNPGKILRFSLGPGSRVKNL